MTVSLSTRNGMEPVFRIPFHFSIPERIFKVVKLENRGGGAEELLTNLGGRE